MMNETKQIKKFLKSLIGLASTYHSEHLSLSVDNFPHERREPTLTDYQRAENVVERHLNRDRRHPLPTVLINNFNDRT
ncbi:MAG: hypothetical protein K2M50_07635, partial [Treponemataceae bacterium]|nr:hypothetical protein [Treponemataceae bacterium]